MSKFKIIFKKLLKINKFKFKKQSKINYRKILNKLMRMMIIK